MGRRKIWRGSGGSDGGSHRGGGGGGGGSHDFGSDGFGGGNVSHANSYSQNESSWQGRSGGSIYQSARSDRWGQSQQSASHSYGGSHSTYSYHPAVSSESQTGSSYNLQQ